MSECTITTKQGDRLALDLSASQIKKLRRAKKKIEMERGGKRYVLDCSKIVEIYPTLK